MSNLPTCSVCGRVYYPETSPESGKCWGCVTGYSRCTERPQNLVITGDQTGVLAALKATKDAIEAWSRRTRP